MPHRLFRLNSTYEDNTSIETLLSAGCTGLTENGKAFLSGIFTLDGMSRMPGATLDTTLLSNIPYRSFAACFQDFFDNYADIGVHTEFVKVMRPEDWEMRTRSRHNPYIYNDPYLETKISIISPRSIQNEAINLIKAVASGELSKENDGLFETTKLRERAYSKDDYLPGLMLGGLFAMDMPAFYFLDQEMHERFINALADPKAKLAKLGIAI